MTQEEIFDYNKRCAEFLGAIYAEHGEAWAFGNPKNIGSKMFHGVMYHNVIQAERFEKELKFHSDWNWIMEVVEKIESLDKLGGIVMIQQGRCKITSIMAGDHSVYADVSLYFTKGMKGQKEAVVEAINQFLIWYNTQKL